MDWRAEIKWQGRNVACMNQGLQLKLDNGNFPEDVEHIESLAQGVIQSAESLVALCKKSRSQS